MDKRYEVYCLADRFFYDSPTLATRQDQDFELARRPVPEGWIRSELDDWRVYEPEPVDLPPQGWKIHVSACIDNCEEILASVWGYCLPRRIAFKFIGSRQLLALRNAKYASRGSSGKFVTIYPDEAHLETVLTELGALLDGRKGPYILSDLRWGAGPLYVRYGGFAERYCIGPDGEQTLAIEDATGRLVPDRRGPTFQVPPWVSLPAFLAPHLDARNAVTVKDLPYRFERALHFSNGGGLYAGVDTRSGDRVVIKEARPYTALDPDGADAVARLRHERDVLARLAGLDVVPGLRDYFTLGGEHEYLVQDFVDGSTLNALLVERCPLIRPELDENTAAEYTAWALEVYGRVEQAVAAVHDRGVVIGDFHPANVLVLADGRVVLVDLEVASLVGEQRRQTLAAPGFMAPHGRTGPDVDRYALACLRLFMFLPLTELLGLDPGKAHELAAEIPELFPVPREFLAEAVRVIGGTDGRSGAAESPPRRSPRLEPDEAGWVRARDSLAGAILASASPHRDDRLFPGDIKQFSTGGLNLAYGAAGVLYALASCGAGRYPAHEEWLVQRASRPRPGTRFGFYDGLHGVAYALDFLDRRSDALRVLDICVDELAGKLDRLGLGLAGGLAGVGLNLAYFARATGEPALWDAAWQVAEVVAKRLGDEDGVAEVSGGRHPYAGLLRGSSGPALMFVRLYEHSGDSALLDLAATALRQDLRRCVLVDYGALEVNEGWRTMPYVADGSVGIGLVLDDYLAHRDDERFERAAAQIRTAARLQFYIEPGLFYGRAGMILYLSREHPPGTAGRDPVVADHVRRLAWHALTHRDQLVFPGDQLLRLSMDLASGGAGVMLALGAALHENPVHLPFLDAPASARVTYDNDLQLAIGGR